MKNSAEHTRALTQLLNRLGRDAPKQPLDARSPVEQLIFSFLAYDASQSKAASAYERLMGHMVDLNDLRVSDSGEIVAVLGANYPAAVDRSVRLRAALNTIYRREHAVDLSSLADKPKKDVRAYLDSLDGVVPYVSAAVTLLSFGGHAIPLDEQLYRKLLADGIIEEGSTFEETQSFLEHHIRFEDAVEAHQRLRAYAERGAGGSSQTRRTKRTTRKVTTKKSKTTTKGKARAGR